MKSPAFQWYAAEYLADERVAQLSLETEAVYVRLLSYCWREGSIPANPAQCAPLCKYADVKVIKPALALFTKTGATAGRLVHKRLEEERAKQEAFRAKQSEKGAKGGRPRKNDESPEKPAVKPEETRGFISVKPDESSSTSTSSANTTDVVATTTPAKSRAEVLASQVVASGDETFTADNWPGLNNPKTFASSLKYLGYEGIDYERYRLDIRGKVKAAAMNAPATALGKYIMSYMANEAKAGPLLQAPVALRPAPVMPDDPCSLWGAPNPDYDHRTYNQPAGQYTGAVR